MDRIGVLKIFYVKLFCKMQYNARVLFIKSFLLIEVL